VFNRGRCSLQDVEEDGRQADVERYDKHEQLTLLTPVLQTTGNVSEIKKINIHILYITLHYIQIIQIKWWKIIYNKIYYHKGKIAAS